MIMYKEVIASVRQGEKALNNRDEDVNHLRFLINKMAYQLKHAVLLNQIEPL